MPAKAQLRIVSKHRWRLSANNRWGRLHPARIPALMPRPSTKIIPIAELEKQTILGTIAQLKGDKLLAARLLGIGKTRFYRKLKEYASQD
jgi:DNA-binding NtrC family response regulator